MSDHLYEIDFVSQDNKHQSKAGHANCSWAGERYE